MQILEGVAAFLLPYIIFPKLCGSESCKVSAESWLTYSSCFIWCLYFVGDRYTRHKHYQSRLQGYLEFYRKTCVLRQVPLYVHSGGKFVRHNAIIIRKKYTSISMYLCVLQAT